MFWWLAQTTVVAAALAGAVALLCRRLRPRPAVRHALWLVVLVKLLMPPLPAWPWPVAATSPPRPEPAEEAPRPPPAEPPPAWPTGEVAALPPTEPFVTLPPDVMPPPPEPAVEEASPAPVELPPVVAAPAGREWLSAAVTVAWAAGAALTALLQLARVTRFRRQVARGGPAPAELTAVVADLARRLGVRAPAVRVVPGLASPVVWGLGRARLLWPAALLGELSPDGERAAVVHELAHLRRRDHWVGWLELVAGCVWWWSPLFWYVRRQLGRAAELACDACVIETLPTARRAYAEALLAVCELVSRRAAPAPALGMGGARQEIERRLTMILRESVPSRAPVRALFGAVLLALIALPGFTDGQAPPAPAKAGDTKEADPTAKSRVVTDRSASYVEAQPAAKPAGDEREQRLQKLEANLEVLLKEVKELRAAGGKTPPPRSGQAAPQTSTGVNPSFNSATTINPNFTTPNVSSTIYYENLFRAGQAPAPEQPLRLERVSYNLPKDKAEALAVLLKDLKTPVLETQVKADGIVVTTTPDAQHVVGEFVSLLRGKVPAAQNRNGYVAPSAK